MYGTTRIVVTRIGVDARHNMDIPPAVGAEVMPQVPVELEPSCSRSVDKSTVGFFLYWSVFFRSSSSDRIV